MTSPIPTIFIVEDSATYQSQYAAALKQQVVIVAARSLKEAHENWGSIQQVALVVMDGCVDSRHYLDSQPLVRKIRKTFSGPIIAASSSSEFRKELLQAGCNHEAEKQRVPAKVLELLGLASISN